MANVRVRLPVVTPFRLRVNDHRSHPARVGDGGTVVREANNGHYAALAKFLPHRIAHSRPDFCRFVQRGPPVADHLLQCGLVMDAKAVPAHFADKRAGGLQRGGGAVDSRRFDCRLAQREPQFRQMGDLFRLSAGRFKEYRRSHASVNVPQRADAVGVQRLGAGGIAGEVRHCGGIQPLLA